MNQPNKITFKSPYSPAQTLMEGDLAVLTSGPHKGYCVEVLKLSLIKASVRFLDSESRPFELSNPIKALVPTGKTPLSILKPFAGSMAKALELERSLPQFEERRARPKTPKTPKPLTETQKNYLATLIKQRLAELALQGKGDSDGKT